MSENDVPLAERKTAANGELVCQTCGGVGAGSCVCTHLWPESVREHQQANAAVLASRPPWIDRIYKFAARMPRKDSDDLATDLEELRDELNEIAEVIDELIPHLDAWTDDELDRSERTEGREAAEQEINELHSSLVVLAQRLGQDTLSPPVGG